MNKVFSAALIFLSLVSYAAPSKVTVQGDLKAVGSNSAGEFALKIAKSAFLDQSEMGQKLTYEECLVKYKNFLTVIQELIRMDAYTKLVNACNKADGHIVFNSIIAGEAGAMGSGAFIKSSVDINGDNISDQFISHKGKEAISQLAPHTSNFYVGSHMMAMCTSGVSFDQFIKDWSKDRPDLIEYWKQGQDFVGGLEAMFQKFTASCK